MAQTSGSSAGAGLLQSLLKWPSWAGWLVVVGAFLLGIGTDAVGSASRTVNILAPPLLLLMLWNVAVYGLIALNSLTRSRHFKSPKLDHTQAIALARGTTVMHTAAAALALGALLAMYWRGLVFDYQALWQSTFLSASSAYSLVSWVLSPAVWLGSYFGGAPFPDLASFEQLHAPASQGENAARWIHWYAITVLLVVLLPRCLLALWSYRTAQQLKNAAVKKLKPQSASPLQTGAKTYTAVQTIALSLVAHTNVGKTTLARTLLGRDIGEVRDAEHVTHTAEKHVLVESEHQGVLERLELWDTPGFGDSELLAKRMSQAGNPIGWFLAEVWDRLQNRAFWYSQRAVRHILDESDVVLYLVNASENPADVAYLDAELKVLDLIGKPVVVLLNQIGEPLTPLLADVERQRWKARVSTAKSVQDVLLLDAFTRCWVQEGRLLEAVARSLPQRQAQFARLNAAWQQRNLQRWQAAMNVLAQRLCRAALDKEGINETGWGGKFKEAGAVIGKAMGLGDGDNTPKALAMKALSKRLDADIRSNMDELIALHHLDGHASSAVLTRLAEHYAVQAPQSEGKAALWGGVVTGALMGLKADILSGGLTLGGGMLAGGVLGALGGAGLARGYNLVTGVATPTIAWTPEVLDDLTRSALLGYLAVAHFGRGRGEWTQTEPPAFWVERIEEALAPQWEKLHAMWEKLSLLKPTDSQTELQNTLLATLQAILIETSQAVLEGLYPEAGALK
jgi:GTP-binding protein EngB required for normal cell division